MKTGRPEHQPLRLGILGMGGYAQSVSELVLSTVARRPDAAARLVAVGDPAAARPDHAAQRKTLASAGVQVLSDPMAVIESDAIDAVWLPLPIHLHRRYVEAAFAAGKHVVCEKPLAGCVADVDGMISARDRSGCTGLVGFQNLYHPQTSRIKRELAEGALGKIERVTVIGSWPRGSVYFGRSAWAGRLSVDGLAVMDSPANNAMAHFVMMALFLLGPSELEAMEPREVLSPTQTWRAARINNYDTVDARLKLEQEVELRLLLTHAARQTLEPQIFIHGERGTWAWTMDRSTPLALPAAQRFVEPSDTREQMPRRLIELLSPGKDVQGPWATFEAARAHALAVAMIGEVIDPIQLSRSSIRPFEAGPEVGVIQHVPGLLSGMIAAARRNTPLELPFVATPAVPPGGRAGVSAS